jgi:hypothetical protein
MKQEFKLTNLNLDPNENFGKNDILEQELRSNEEHPSFFHEDSDIINH